MAWLLHLEQVLQAPDALTGYLLLGVPRSKYLLSIWCNGKRTRTVTGMQPYKHSAYLQITEEHDTVAAGCCSSRLL